MGWTTPVDQTTGHLVTAVEYNTQIIDNLKYLHGDGGATIDLSGGGQMLLNGIFTTGPTANSFTGSQTQGVIATSTSGLGIFRGTNGTLFQTGRAADTQPTFTINVGGAVGIGSGSSATDVALVRADVGALRIGNVKRAVNAVLAYSASITPDPRTGEYQVITVTNGTAFTINAPSPAPLSSDVQDLSIEILNSSGGAMGVVTWNANYLFGPGGFTWANPANTKRRSVHFRWNGANWIAIANSANDY